MAPKEKQKGKKSSMEKLAPNWMTPQMMDWLSERLNTDVEVLLSETEVLTGRVNEGENNRLVERGDADAKVWKAANMLAYKEALGELLQNIETLKGIGDSKLKKEFGKKFTVGSKQIDNFVIKLAQKERKYNGDYKWVKKPISNYSDELLSQARELAGEAPAPMKAAPKKAAASPAPKQPEFRQYTVKQGTNELEEKKPVPQKVATEAKLGAPAQKEVKNPKKEVEAWLDSKVQDYAKLTSELRTLARNEETASRARRILGKREKLNGVQKEMYQEALFAKWEFSGALVTTLLQLLNRVKENEERFAKDKGRHPKLVEAYKEKAAEVNALFKKYTDISRRADGRLMSNKALLAKYESWQKRVRWGSVAQSEKKVKRMLADAKAGKRRMTLEELRQAAKQTAREFIKEKANSGEVLELSSGSPEEVERLTNTLIAQAERDAETEVTLAAARFRKGAPAEATSEIQLAKGEGKGKKKKVKVFSPAPKKINEKAGLLDGIFSAIGSFFSGGKKEGEA